MGGLARICKMYGCMEVTGVNGDKVTWIWDYVNRELPTHAKGDGIGFKGQRSN